MVGVEGGQPPFGLGEPRILLIDHGILRCMGSLEQLKILRAHPVVQSQILPILLGIAEQLKEG